MDLSGPFRTSPPRSLASEIAVDASRTKPGSRIELIATAGNREPHSKSHHYHAAGRGRKFGTFGRAY